ncbi:class II aldolase/adducin family protein [Streptomyces sp. NBC_00249]|uniref:class II aldolase/adducin family protein n=1 Tax=Streptomyces sp. NBC_00249 TaxID=2975690 RepID=UPI00225330B4|nr:class II aldolase/adducin family protein [Streptomyces sp. NBC_00249]MCX5194909.1 class II aldolase/adducin family protein [Streptomyces sp. NBC_00249]
MAERPAPVPVERLRFEMPPVFATAGQARAHRKERLAEALRLLGRLGYEDGVGALVSVRDPEFADCYWVNPFGRAAGGLTAADLLLVDGEGRVLQGERRVNQLAFGVHAAVHRQRPGLVAVVRAQGPYGTALACLGELLAPVTEEACAFYEDHALLDEFVGDGDPGRIAVALGPYKALILRGRGLLTVGDSVEAALWWFHAAERAARTQLLARAAGKPVPVEHRAAVAVRERFGSDLAAWVSYQPLRDAVLGAPSGVAPGAPSEAAPGPVPGTSPEAAPGVASTS